VPALTFEWPDEPRAALGWSFAAPLAICVSRGLLPDAADDITAAAASMRAQNEGLQTDAPEAANAAKQLARRLHGRLPVFAGAEALAPVAYRWRTQVNENAKSWAIADELPEMNHNAQAGYGLPQRVVPLLHVVLLHHASAHPRMAPRIEATQAELSRAGVSSEVVQLEGASLLAQMLCGVLFGDWTSYYLGILNGVHPSPVDGLVRTKEFLRGRA
jgi:glucose/mannose-6-phosphate isomerase